VRKVYDHSAEFWSFLHANDPLNVVVDDVADQLLSLGLIPSLELFVVEETHHLVVEDDREGGRGLILSRRLGLGHRLKTRRTLHSLDAHLPASKLRLPMLHLRVDLVVVHGLGVLLVGHSMVLLLASIHLHPHLLRCLVCLGRRNHGWHLMLVALVLLGWVLLGRNLVWHGVAHLGDHLGLLLLFELGRLELRRLLCVLVESGCVGDVGERATAVHVLIGLLDLAWPHSVALDHRPVADHVVLLVASSILILAVVALLSVAIVVVVVMAALIIVPPVASILVVDASHEHLDSLHDLVEGEVRVRQLQVGQELSLLLVLVSLLVLELLQVCLSLLLWLAVGDEEVLALEWLQWSLLFGKSCSISLLVADECSP
jgi:hypothetical protein